MSGACYRQQQEQEEQQQYEAEMAAYLWSCLQAMRGHISAETFQQVERELGFRPIQQH